MIYQKEILLAGKNGIIICTAAASDKSRIYELFLEMLRSIYGEDAWDPGDSFLDKYFSGGNDVIWLAKAGNRTVAFLSVEEHHEDEDYLYLDDLCVEEASRGQGIGSVLLKKAEEQALQRSIPYIVLHVESSNIRARKLYASLGYEESGTNDSRIRMIKTIR